jgi:Fic family protein
VAYVWQPIEDLPQNAGSLTNGELGPLTKFWADQRQELEATGELQSFTTRLNREWAIETGQIEGVYDLDRGVTQTLIERGINADLIPPKANQRLPEVVAAIILDHQDVLEGLFQFVKGERPLSKSYIHELHAALLRHQDTTTVLDQFGHAFEARLQKGRYKERPNNPLRPDGKIHQYCPPEQVDSEMERLLAMHERHVKEGVPIEIQSAWLHHRFTQIHPYQDGNGRVARALASLMFIRDNWFPILITRDDRPRYIDSLEVADEGDLRSLVALFVDVQKRALFQATQAAADVQPVHSVDEAIASVKKVLVGVGTSLEPVVWKTTKERADRLMEVARKRFEEVVALLRKEIGKNRPDLNFAIQDGGPTFLHDLKLDYIPNTLEYNQLNTIAIRSQSTAYLMLDAHAVGSKFRGLIAIVSAFGTLGTGGERTSTEPFQVNYVESYESIEKRFIPWLEDAITNALTLWRKSL